jgi:hypothetical protein
VQRVTHRHKHLLLLLSTKLVPCLAAFKVAPASFERLLSDRRRPPSFLVSNGQVPAGAAVIRQLRRYFLDSQSYLPDFVTATRPLSSESGQHTPSVY